MCTATCWTVYVPSHPQASPVAECRAWLESEDFLRCLPQGEQRAGSREPASATYTDSSAKEDDRRFSFSASEVSSMPKSFVKRPHKDFSQNLTCHLHGYKHVTQFSQHSLFKCHSEQEKKRKWDYTLTLWICFISTSLREKRKSDWWFYLCESTTKHTEISHKKNNWRDFKE